MEKEKRLSVRPIMLGLAAGSLWFAMPITESVAAVFATARMQHSHSQPLKGTPQK